MGADGHMPNEYDLRGHGQAVRLLNYKCLPFLEDKAAAIVSRCTNDAVGAVS
jgi:hypothetical protein